MKQNIQIDREFKNLTAPISEEEQEILERSLMREGCLEPIIVWRGVILDGHKRYDFCTYEEIEFEVQEMDFTSREEAIIWVCRQRIPDFTIHQPMYRYLVGKWYNCKKLLNKELRRQSSKDDQNPDYVEDRRNSLWNTSNRLAEEIGIARSTIEANGKVALVMDRIAEMEPALFDAILRGDARFKKDEVLLMAKMDEKQISEVRRKKLGKKDVKLQKRNKQDAWGRRIREERVEDEIPIKTGIKEMPAFDPDMEIKGLALTIPTWINAIVRTEKNMDVNIATDKAKEQLTANLIRLKEQIGSLLEVLQ